MLWLFFLFVNCINGCFNPHPNSGNYYIKEIRLLDAIEYPDSVLLEIYKVIEQNSPINDLGPKCKIMNINDGSVSQSVNCNDYSGLIRDFSIADIDTTNTNVTCNNVNCDGSTTLCNIIRNNNLYEFNLNTNCAPTEFGYDKFISFTINELSTTYIIFQQDIFGLVFTDSLDSSSFKIINVQQKGDDDLHFLRFNTIDTNSKPTIYSSSNIIKNELGCCGFCYSYRLSTYKIEDDTNETNNYDQIFTFKSFQEPGGYIDAVKSRIYYLDRYYSDYINIYKLSDDQLIEYKPNLIF